MEIDQVTKVCSSGYASVSFIGRDNFLVGLKALNGLKIGESIVKVRPTCTTDFNSSTSIFIRNITDTTTIKDFLPVLSQFGNVLSAYIPVDPILKKSKGIAYVDFDTPEAAKAAIEQLNNKPSPKGDSQLMVLPYQPPVRGALQQTAPQYTLSRTNLFVKNLPFTIQDGQVASLFSKFGQIRSIKVKRPDIDPRFTYQTSGYAIAYVNFEKEEDAKKAIAELNNQTVGNQVITVESYDRSQQAHIFVGPQDLIQNENLKALHIQGINKELTEERLKEITLKFGPTQYVKLRTVHLPDGRQGKSTAEVFYLKKEDAG